MGLKKMVLLLLRAGADPSVVGKDGTPAGYSILSLSNCLDVTKDPEIKQILAKATPKKKRVTVRSSSQSSIDRQAKSPPKITNPDNKISLTIKSPELTELQLRSTFSLDWTVGQILNGIRKKFPGETVS